MTKVLSGSSRAAFDFVLTHWRGLLNISVVPVAFILAIAWVQLKNMSTMLEFLALQAKLGDKFDLAQMGPFMANLSKFYAIGLLSMLAMVWLFVRVVRFWKTGEGTAFAVTNGEIGATFLTILYSIGIMLLTMLVYIGGGIVIALLAGLGAAIFGDSALGVVGGVALVILAIAALLGLFLFMYRFLVGLPGVAMGEVPGFFSDIWPLAKGESWGVPLRIILWSLVAAIPILVLSMTFTFPVMTDIQTQLVALDKPEMTPDMISNLMKTMVPLQIVNLVIQMPIIWFFSVLLSEAHYRFRAKL
jgi:hypothetical protein